MIPTSVQKTSKTTYLHHSYLAQIRGFFIWIYSPKKPQTFLFSQKRIN